MEETKVGSAQTDESSASTENKATFNHSAAEEYKRDMFKYKNENRELRAQLEEKMLAEEEQKGNLQSVIQRLKDENKHLKKSTADDRYNFAQGKIEDAIKTFAAKKGCTDPDTFYKLIDDADVQTVELDDKFRTSSEDIESIVEKNMQRYEHLGFFKKNVKIADGSPSSKPVEKKAKEVDLSKLSHEDLMKVASDAGFKRIEY